MKDPGKEPILGYSRLFQQDLDEISSRIAPHLINLNSSAHFFVTGATGFIGKWILAGLMQSLNPSVKITCLARNPIGFLENHPEYLPAVQGKRLAFIKGDVRNFDIHSVSNVTHIIHAATPASATLNQNSPSEMLDIIVRGAESVVKVSRINPVEAVLFLSSGAVYGRQPPDLHNVSELFHGAPDPLLPTSAYGEGKRYSELILRLASEESRNFIFTSARAFAFIGPHLPIDGTFAAGNFIRDTIANTPISIEGDGTPFRSYMYPTDLIHALMLIILNGKSGRAYNVGAEDAISIEDFAKRMNAVANQHFNTGSQTAAPVVKMEKTANVAANRYVPSIARLREELHFAPKVDLDEAIFRTLRWFSLSK